MPESRRSLHLHIATLTALLGLQLASCAAVQSGPDENPPGILNPGAQNHQTAQNPTPGPRPAVTQQPLAGGPQIALLLPLSGRQGPIG